MQRRKCTLPFTFLFPMLPFLQKFSETGEVIFSPATPAANARGGGEEGKKKGTKTRAASSPASPKKSGIKDSSLPKQQRKQAGDSSPTKAVVGVRSMKKSKKPKQKPLSKPVSSPSDASANDKTGMRAQRVPGFDRCEGEDGNISNEEEEESSFEDGREQRETGGDDDGFEGEEGQDDQEAEGNNNNSSGDRNGDDQGGESHDEDGDDEEEEEDEEDEEEEEEDEEVELLDSANIEGEGSDDIEIVEDENRSQEMIEEGPSIKRRRILKKDDPHSEPISDEEVDPNFHR